MSLRDRVVDFRRVPAADLAPHPRNFRVHPKHQQSALRGLLDEVGFAGAVLARQGSDGKLVLIDGHLRKDLLPGEKIPVEFTGKVDVSATYRHGQFEADIERILKLKPRKDELEAVDEPTEPDDDDPTN